MMKLTGIRKGGMRKLKDDGVDKLELGEVVIYLIIITIILFIDYYTNIKENGTGNDTAIFLNILRFIFLITLIIFGSAWILKKVKFKRNLKGFLTSNVHRMPECKAACRVQKE